MPAGPTALGKMVRFSNTLYWLSEHLKDKMNSSKDWEIFKQRSKELEKV